MLFVGFAFSGDDGVFGQRQLAALQIFLQLGLGILGKFLRFQFGDDGRVQGIQHSLRLEKTAVKVDRADDGFQGIGQNGRPAETTAFQLAFAEEQVISQLQALCDIRQGRLLHQMRPDARQVALGQLGEIVKKFGGNHQG
jgi:hypothetical protein